MPTNVKRQLSEATIYIRDQMPYHPRLGITLGSGLAKFADHLEKAVRIPFAAIPHFAPPTVEGHGSHLVVGFLGKTPIAILQGRVHYYEGHDLAQVVFPTRVMAQLGIKTLLLTNASGGIAPKMQPGDFMVIRDHINFIGQNPLRGPNLEFLGPRFPDLTDLYDPHLGDILKKSLKKSGARFSEGVYCGVAGPSYETAAEVRFLQTIGGHAVGMSTVAEAIAARHAGMKVAGLACVTNLATGLSSQKISHEEVKAIAQMVEDKFAQTLMDFTENCALEGLI